MLGRRDGRGRAVVLLLLRRGRGAVSAAAVQQDTRRRCESVSGLAHGASRTPKDAPVASAVLAVRGLLCLLRCIASSSSVSAPLAVPLVGAVRALLLTLYPRDYIHKGGSKARVRAFLARQFSRPCEKNGGRSQV